MRKCFFTVVFLAFCPLLTHTFMARAQSDAVNPQRGPGHSNQATCVILKRMGPADEVTSHLYSFGIRGKQFQFVEGDLPKGSTFHGRLTDHDLRGLQERGAKVIIVEVHYTTQDLKAARAECQGITETNPNQTSETKDKSQQNNQVQSINASVSPLSAIQASLTIDSTPSGADIEIDGEFVGNTPSTVTVAPGSHRIAVKKKGYADWGKTLNVTGGTVHLNAELEQVQSQPPVAVPPPPPPAN